MMRNSASRRKTSPRPRLVRDPSFSTSWLTYYQRANERILKSLTEKCDGIFGTAAEAIENISVPEVKPTRPYSTYKGKLSLGDWKKFESTAMYIDVNRLFKTKKATPVSASNFVTRSSTDVSASGQFSHTLDGDKEMADAPELAAVKSSRTYEVNDAEGAGGKKNVDRDELARGFEYGRTAVHISESDENVTKLETFQEFTIIGFIPSDKVCILRVLNLICQAKIYAV